MDNSNLLQLTNHLYKLTLLFPKKEPLRYKARELASQILVNSITKGNLQTESGFEGRIKELNLVINNDLEILRGFFDIAREQNWASLEAIAEIEKQYQRLEDSLAEKEPKEEVKSLDFSLNKEETREELPKEPEMPVLEGEVNLGPRKGKILELMQRRDKIQVGELCQIFPRTSKRTIRRDFRDLLQRGLVERVGDNNTTFYRLNKKEG